MNWTNWLFASNSGSVSVSRPDNKGACATHSLRACVFVHACVVKPRHCVTPPCMHVSYRQDIALPLHACMCHTTKTLHYPSMHACVVQARHCVTPPCMHVSYRQDITLPLQACMCHTAKTLRYPSRHACVIQPRQLCIS